MVTAQLVSDLQLVFTDRLESVVVYGAHAEGARGPIHTLVLVTRLELADLDGLARRRAAWAAESIATPLVLGREEFARSLDAFPLEFGAILASHRVVYGSDPFEHLAVDPGDLRRACEIEVKGHLLHLRESYVEAGGDPSVIAEVVSQSAPALRAVLQNLARLDAVTGGVAESPGAFARRLLGPVHGDALGGVLALTDAPIPDVDAARLFPAYLAAVGALADHVDTWHG
jgi:hypothetical protein